MNIFNLLNTGATRYAKQSAVFHGTELHCSWEDLHNRSLKLAKYLAENMSTGARVAVVASNCPEYIEIMFATWAAGLVIVPVNAKLHHREIEQIVSDSGATLIFATPAQAKTLEKESLEIPIITIGSAGYCDMLQGGQAIPAEIAPDDLAWLFYTSGTTGRSKGAMLSHRNLMAMATAHLADFESLHHEHAILHAAPMSHGSGLYILPYVARAARQIVPLSGGFDTQEIFQLCSHHDRVGMFMAPTMVHRLRQEAERIGGKPKGLRRILYGGGPMYLEEIRKTLETFGPIFCQLYGQGEAPMTITGLRSDDFQNADDTVLSSVGWPRTGVEVAVFDQNDRPLAAGEIGEVVCRGDVVMSGYWQNETATKQTLASGWLHTGDIGVVDKDGKLTLRGRSKEVIISGGSNIYPQEVEEVLLSCPGVEEACVIGEVNTEWGEIVVAFIVQQTSIDIDANSLDAHCLNHIARFKKPKRYIFVDELPRNPTGKILKRELISRLGNQTHAQ